MLINCDLEELPHLDPEVMPHIHLANIACGDLQVTLKPFNKPSH